MGFLGSLAGKIGLGIAGLLLVLLGIQTWRLGQTQEKLEVTRAAFTLFAERVKTKAEEIQRKALERNERVRVDQDRISQEVSRDYQARIDDLRRRYADLLRRPSGTNPGGGGNAVPAPRPAPGGTDAAPGQGGFPAFTLEDALIASETAVRLLALQDWVRRQAAIDPNAPQ